MRTSSRPWACGALFAVVLAVIIGCAGATNRALNSIDNAINELKQGNKTFGEIKTILEGTKNNLDEGVYKNQVAELIDRTGKISELSVQGTVDFTRSRVIDDLENIKRSILGQPPKARVPVLANGGLPTIDFKSTTRSTVTIVGWNLDIAEKSPETYKVVIKNKNGADTAVDRRDISFQGQYALTLDVSSTGIKFKPFDNKIVFQGYEAVYEVPIINSVPPPPPERIVSVSGHIKTTNQDREGGFCILELKDGDKTLWSHKFPEYPTWDDWHDEPFAFSALNVPVPASPRFLITLTQVGARERNILWRFEAKAEFRTDRNNTIVFEQTGLELHCGDGRPPTVSTNVNQLK